MRYRFPLLAIMYFVVPLLLVVACHETATFAETPPARVMQTKTVHVDQSEQLFLDDYLIESTDNITRRINSATKHKIPVVQRDQSWEQGGLYLFGTILYDHETKLFKMWHYSDGDVGYLTSKDGIVWNKPKLNVILRDGKKTNLIMERSKKRGVRGPYGYIYEIFGVIKDKADPDPNRRYKMSFLGIDFNYDGKQSSPYHPRQRRGLGTAVSPDGIHWTLETEWASFDILDGMSCVLWDASRKRYLAYGRTKLVPGVSDKRWAMHGWGRAVTQIESKDFRTWSKGELVMAADHKDSKGSEVYSLSVLPYQGLYIGFVQMYSALPDQGNLEIQLAVSRDGKMFNRVDPRVPFIGEGAVGEWDRFNISISTPPLEVGDELWFYYSGRTHRHPPYNGKDSGQRGGSIGFAKIKRGRFLSLEASYDAGIILTKPIIIEGDRMFVNTNTSYGTIDIELLDKDEKPIPGGKTTIRKMNDIAVPVTFKKGLLAEQKGKVIRIRFTLKNAQIYGFRFSQDK